MLRKNFLTVTNVSMSSNPLRQQAVSRGNTVPKVSVTFLELLVDQILFLTLVFGLLLPLK